MFASAGQRFHARGGSVSLLVTSFALVACGARDALLSPQQESSEGGAGASSGEGGGGGEGNVGGAPPRGKPLAAGAYHTCVVRAGELACWGSNAEGQLGTGDFVDSYSPVVAAVPSSVVAVATGYRHTCAVASSNRVYCWGENGVGQVGIVSEAPRVPTPAEVPLPGLQGATIVSIAAGEYHSCVGLTDGRVFCWGDNTNGQLGAGTEQEWNNPPILAANLGAAAALAAGDFHSCASNRDNTVCWGANFYGQLGSGSTAPSDFPIAVLKTGFVAIESKGFATLALDERGGLFGWGDNGTGMLGTYRIQSSLEPMAVFEDRTFQSVGVGLAHVCALDSGALACWGDNSYGELGNGTMVSSAQPVVTPLGGEEAIAIAAGTLHACALTADAAVYCWGQNDEGRCGSAPGAPLLSATVVEGL